MLKAQYQLKNLNRAVRCWLIPYMFSRIYSKEFKPLLSYLYTDWKCNIDCHYCWAYQNNKEGMTLATAKQSIDFLKSAGCRVLAIMGGEPTIRKDFILEVVKYGSKNGFFVYFPTNGRLMNPDFVNKLGESGVAAVNLAVDCVSEKPGLPKNLVKIEKYFKHMAKQQKEYGYILFFNICITRKNMDDVKTLTEIAQDNEVGTDYHAIEPHIIAREHFQHDDTDLYFREEDYQRFDELIDWLIEQNNNGCVMVNSQRHFEAMKEFVRGRTKSWRCRAGQNSLFIGVNGEILPCFGLYESNVNCGTVYNHEYDLEKLDTIKENCNKKCFSTCNYNLSYYYRNFTVHEWIFKHSKNR